MVSWLAIIGFGAFHGLNPGMGWLFALSMGLQQKSERAIWIALVPIALGHAASVGLVALVVLAGLQFFSVGLLQWLTATVLLVFGLYKLFNYYRHPKWTGMKVGLAGLFAWSFLMATAHGAGLMIAPMLVEVAGSDGAPMDHGAHAHHVPEAATGAGEVALAVGVHTAAMLIVMGVVALVVYRKLGLAVLRQAWINFDLIWAVALLVAGGAAVIAAIF